ncbi:DUF4175 family protein [Robertkochia sediminum]|uniref:DUF4175 family protein n=1 Tax=Robertkochia sediminum TaxID=2785326 RepID=UPI001932EC70|nr:DUF4175 family protein [Robertkochia sediminum]MBL7471477.1 DUF4175 family protein [Robertkochia sediminum]
MEDHIRNIKNKLDAFFRKYYTGMLLRGMIMFLSVGGCYFLITLAVEYFLWLSPGLRRVLFWSFIAVELFLFVRFIIIPLLYLFKIRKGLDELTASRLIGAHFPEVNDKLVNLLQLNAQSEKNELLLASIAQRSEELKPIPFQKAIQLSANIKYLKYLTLPAAILLLVWLSGKAISFKDSYNRMVDHTTAYAPPAPFHFEILNDSLTAVEGEAFRLRVTTKGNIAPEMVQLEREGKLSYMQPNRSGIFEYTLQPKKGNTQFYLTANGVVNGPYTLKVLPVPSLLHFDMLLDFPGYTGRKDEKLDNSGNATVPEGTKITWNVRARNTERVELMLPDTVKPFAKNANEFKIYHKVYKSMNYAISSSNNYLQRYEWLGFHINVIRDQAPKISTKRDESAEDINTQVITGEISDDYGLSKLELVVYPEDDLSAETSIVLSRPKGNIDKFRYTFPGNLSLEPGKNYLYYFRVTDNDGLRPGGKSAKSSVYAFFKLTQNAVEKEQLDRQKEQLKDLGKSLKEMQIQGEKLEEITNINRQKNELNYNDQRKLQNFLDRQQQQEALMKEYTKKLQDDLNTFPGETPQTEEFNELLKERLERQQEEIEKNEKLLEELNKYTEKLNKQELEQKLEELAKKQQSNKRSLEQVLELTKRYYVQTRAANIRQALEEQAKAQDSLANYKTENEKEEQSQLNQKFEKTAKELRVLEKENQQLKKPMDLGTDERQEDEIKTDQKEALDKLSTPADSSQASSPQKKAAQKLKKMANEMQSAMSMEGATTLNEDITTLRQILDNLLKFTFDQEEIMETLNTFNQETAQLPQQLKAQNDLKALFEHIDDSLFALSLRQPDIGEMVNNNITEVYYNMNKALERFADNQYYQGVTHQQYTLTAANNLSDFLSNTMDQMQNMMMGQGSGENSFQLPDIIKSQEQLNEQMQKGMKPSQGDKNQDGQKPSEQEGEGKGENGGQQQGEENAEQLFEIYKQQQQLREALKQQLKNITGESERKRADELLRQMERTENALLNNGYSERTLRQMQNLKHRLMELEQAEKLQGEQNERKSTTNRKEYTQNSSNQSPETQESYQELEILQRQVLPLREIYKQKVQRYFKGND